MTIPNARPEINEKLAIVKSYLALGWSIIPLKARTKNKFLDEWKKYQEQPPEYIQWKRWLNKWPSCNVALVTGKLSNVIVIDFDSSEALEVFRAQYDLPDTIFQYTGRGLHYFFKHPHWNYGIPEITNSASKILPDLDIRCDGGCAVIYPSIHPNGEPYQWGRINPIEDGLNDLLDLTPELLDLIQNGPKEPVPKPEKSKVVPIKNFNATQAKRMYDPNWVATALKGVHDGIRNENCKRLIGYFYNIVGESEIEQKLLKWDLKNKPPLGEKVIKRSVKSVIATIKAKEVQERKKTRGNFTLKRVGDLEMKAPEWAIEKLIEADTMALIFGDPGTGKTFLAIDMSCCIATDTPFHGRAITKPAPVIYIAGEGQSGMARRFNAWAIVHKINIKDIPVFVSTVPTALCNKDQVKFVLDEVEKIAGECGVGPGMIVLDTVARNFGNGNENATQDMSAFIQAADLIRCQYNSIMLLIHHSGHGNKDRARGAMALKAALDAEYRTEKTGSGIINVRATKMKDSVYPDPIAFEMRTVELPVKNEEGVPATSIILHETEEGVPATSIILHETEYIPEMPRKGTGGGKWQKGFISLLENLYDLNRAQSGPDKDPEDVKVTKAEFRNYCYDAGMSKPTFHRHFKDYLQTGGIQEEEGWVFLR